MELEFAADAAAIGDLLRLKPLARAREGRARNRATKTVWHDSSEQALRRAGLALAEQHGTWRLERLLPTGTEVWLPAQPAPIVAEAADPAALPSLPAPLAPLAAFEGRHATAVHRLEPGPVDITVAHGILRAVTAERPAARLWLRGEPAAVEMVLSVISEAVPIRVPQASLAAEAIALATGLPLAPRHVGAPVLPDGIMSPVDALRLILGHLADVMLAWAPAAAGSDPPGIEAVHQMRVAVRRARSAVTVFRQAMPPGSLDALRDGLKALGARLAPRRDWDVFLTETMPAIRQSLPPDARLDRLVTAAERQRRECRDTLAAYLAGPMFRTLMLELAWFAAAFSPKNDSPENDGPQNEGATTALPGFAAAVLGQRHRKLVAAGKRMPGMDVAGLHGVRLRAKQVRYAAEMFSALFPNRQTGRFVRRLSALQQRLGALNDGAVASELMAQLGGASGRHAYAAGVITGFLAARTDKARPRIVRAFDKFRRQPAYWD